MKTTPRLALFLVVLTLLAAHPRLAGQSMPGFSVLHTFTGNSDGSNPFAGLVQGSDGNFYGTTINGGGNGTAFRITPTGTFDTIHSFTGDGTSPNSRLILGADGNFYGTTSAGGGGTVFEMTPEGMVTTLYRFGNRNPIGVVQGSDGNFYGTTSDDGTHGSGTVYKLTPAGEFTLLYNFSAVNSAGTNRDGAQPYAQLIQGDDGNFYGTTLYGGSTASDVNPGFACGTVFKITPEGTLTTLHNFMGADGRFPEGAMVRGSDGNLYGTTVAGGGDNGGAVFRITPAGAFTMIGSIGTGTSNGAFADAGLIQGSDGNFYGTTEQGGTPGTRWGTVYEVTPDGVFTTLHGFSGFNSANTDGGYIYAPVVEGSDGNLYGVAYYGGANSLGTIFRLDTKLRGSVQFAAVTTTSRETDATVSLQVTRGDTSTATVSVQYATVDGTALDGRDYTAKSGTVSWVEGDTSPKTITVHLLNPGEEYPNARRRFTVNLNAPSGTSLGANAVATVVLRGTTEVPVITSPSMASGEVGAAFAYRITATRSPRQFAALGLPKGLTLDPATGVISGVAPAEGTHVLTLRAFNQGGEGTAKLTLTFMRQAPVITSPKQASGTLGARFTYQITATGAPGHFTVDDLGGGMTLDSETGLISGYPLGTGTHTLTLHAFNPEGEGTQTLTLTIDKEAPVITSATTASGVEGASFSYQITADNDPSQFHVLRLPTGLSVDPATGLISGTPTVTGTFHLTLEAYNGKGRGTATLTLTLGR